LAAGFDFHAALQAAGNARALELVAEALEPLPGEKVLLYFGFGVGRLSLTGGPGAEYDRALAALKRAGIGVFVLDVTEADFHTLELALKDVVDETGGTYLRARDTSKETLARLATVATSYYQLHVDPRDLPRRPGRVDVDLVGGRGRVLVPRGVSLGRGDATPRVEGPGAGGGSR
jgi:hypothetical protein